MADNTKIEWTEATWNPITGCTVTSPGCTNCYAMKLAGTRLRNHPSRAGLTQMTKAGPVWTGEVRFNEQWLDQPLRWKRPRMIFVCAHGDLFHESVPDEWIDRVFAVMALCPQHTFQVLTKRSARMREYLADDRLPGVIARAILDMALALPALFNRAAWPVWSVGEIDFPCDVVTDLPLPNVWLGVSVEDQTRADERIPDLLATPAAVRWISAEPLLGPVDVRPWVPNCYECGGSCGLRLPGPSKVERCTECGEECDESTEPVFSEGCPHCSGELEFVCPDCGHYMVYQHPDTPNLDWVVAGGESGPGARPMHPDWPRSLRDQCAAAGVPFFFKQHGQWEVAIDRDRDDDDWRADYSGEFADHSHLRWLNIGGGSGFHGARFHVMRRVSKASAGRALDGVEHNEVPHA